MDNLDSQFPFFLFSNHSQSQQIHSLNQNRDLINQIQRIDSLQTCISTEQKSKKLHKKRFRIDNNIFKTPLSEFRKIMLTKIKEGKRFIQLFYEINKLKNYSTFIKLILLLGKLNIKQSVKDEFQKKIVNNLRKKQEKIQKIKYQQLQNIYKRMLRSLSCDTIQQSIQQYWGPYRQKTKFDQSCKNIKSFEKQLETIDLYQKTN